MKSILSLALAASTAIALSACEPRPDRDIENQFTKSYTYRNYLKDDNIKITSRNGDVVLTGVVKQDYHRGLAEDTAAAIPGVQQVDNRIEVRGEKFVDKSDGWIKAKIKTALLFHRNVSATKTEVQVNDGIVTLTGPASSQAQKELTTEYVKDVDGVRDVRNEMVVASASADRRATTDAISEVIDDASITAQVKMSLLTHRSTSALRTKVKTENGVVTLAGYARTSAEKDLAGKLAADVSGVKRVNNDMMVEGGGTD